MLGPCVIPEFEVEPVPLPQGRESEERAAIETARPKLTGQRRVNVGRPGTVSRSAKARPSVAALVSPAATSNSAGKV